MTERMTPERHYAKGQEYLIEADSDALNDRWADAQVVAFLAEAHFSAARTGAMLRRSPTNGKPRA